MILIQSMSYQKIRGWRRSHLGKIYLIRKASALKTWRISRLLAFPFWTTKQNPLQKVDTILHRERDRFVVAFDKESLPVMASFAICPTKRDGIMVYNHAFAKKAMKKKIQFLFSLMTVPPIFFTYPQKNNDLLASMVATSWKEPFPSLLSTPCPLQFLRPLPPKQFKNCLRRQPSAPYSQIHLGDLY